MNKPNNREIVEQYYTTLRGNQAAVMREFVDPNVTVYVAASLPWHGEYHGYDGFQKSADLFFGQWDDLQMHDLEFVGTDDKIFAVSRITGKSKKTGELLEMPLAEMFTLRGGKIIEVRPFYFDTAEMLCVIGATKI